ncbi:unnamed protein product [Rotaria sp. Silwood2]|nr:unnamed protein product [Rotaria sp. Silwood2]CAF2683861.1 unnamed protein product [Rotaria sp. Silwood2]CAF3031396.1 unnamed protein product [Rotaria sp. Silwood2]CAF3278470.1 unnamed protein product [Rotaria sp. Silwood2]CAF3882020.1 unnamed protein product [Rotaria sp. Silwood2]
MYSETTQNHVIMWTVKPLLMPVLLVLFLLNAHNNLSLERRCLMIALIFSWFGDLLLMLHRNDLFVFGLASFLIAHITYVISFIVRLQHEGNALRQRLTMSTMLITSIPFLAYITLMLYILSPRLNTNLEETKGLLIPVVFYITIIVGMAYTSYLRNRKASGFWSVFAGAVFFVMSDTILAFNRFVTPLPTPGLFIMFTYGVGQYLITIGTLQVADKDLKIA